MTENSIVFIGGGKISRWVADQIDLDVLGFYDTDKTRSTFDSLNEAIDANADIYAIATPSSDHIHTFSNLCSRLEKKIITIEKPTFLRMKDFDVAEEIIKRSSNKVYPVFQHRYTLPKLDVGKVFHAQVRVNWCRPQRYYDQADWRGTWQHDGGVLTNQGVHAIDIIRYMLGDIKYVNFEMSTAGVDIETEDVACGILKTIDDVIVSVCMTTTCRPHNHVTDLTVFGQDGFQVITLPDDYGSGHKFFYENLPNDAIIQDMSDAKKTMQVLHDAYESAYGQSMLGEHV
tara:strand:+ start:38 stop:898 length:861 start_codon:yes stop_codon:yes gene_type:complete